MIAKIIDTIMDFLYDLAVLALAILPDSPFRDIDTSDLGIFGDVMGYVNYFVPISTFLLITTAYLSAVLVWYAVRWILRLVQYID